MNISNEVIRNLQAQIDAIHIVYQARLIDEQNFPHVASRPVIERIPAELVRAVLENRDCIDLCQFCEFSGAITTPLFKGERLFYLPAKNSHYFAQAGKPERVWLFGAAKRVYDYCHNNGLAPKLRNFDKKTVTTETATASWSVCTLSISWGAPLTAALLKLKTFNAPPNSSAV